MSYSEITSNVYDALLLSGYSEGQLKLWVTEVNGYIGYEDDITGEVFDILFEKSPRKDYIRFAEINTSNGEAYVKETIFHDAKKFYKYLYKKGYIFKDKTKKFYKHLCKKGYIFKNVAYLCSMQE